MFGHTGQHAVGIFPELFQQSEVNNTPPPLGRPHWPCSGLRSAGISDHIGDITLMSPARINLCCLMQCEARHRQVMTSFRPVTCSPALPGPGHLSTKTCEKYVRGSPSPVSTQHDLARSWEAHRVRADSWRVPIHWSPSSVTRPGHRKEKGEPQTLGSSSTESNCHQTFLVDTEAAYCVSSWHLLPLCCC